MSQQPPQQQPPQHQPSKLFYRIGEVSSITGLEPYVLRYWETEFPHLKPEKRKSGQRLYTKKDLDNILQVKQLLYQNGYTISGARKKLRGRGRQDVDSALETAKQEIREILELLKEKKIRDGFYKEINDFLLARRSESETMAKLIDDGLAMLV